MYWRYIVCCCGICVWFPGSRAPAADPADVRAAFREIYAPERERLAQYYSNIEISATRQSSDGTGKAQVMELHGRFNLTSFKLEGNGKVIDETTRSTEGVYQNSEIDCSNPRYWFSLIRNRADTHVLKRLDLAKSGKTPPICCFLVPVADPWRTKTFAELADDDDTEFVKLADSQWQGSPAKELQTRYKRWLADTKEWREFEVSYFFSPGHWECVGRRSTMSGSPNVSEATYFYAPRNSVGLEDLRRTECWSRAVDSEERKFAIVEDILRFEHCAAFDDSEFTLSAYGLPEPDAAVIDKGARKNPNLPNTTRSKTWLYLTMGGAGAFVLAGALTWVRRRLPRSAA